MRYHRAHIHALYLGSLAIAFMIGGVVTGFISVPNFSNAAGGNLNISGGLRVGGDVNIVGNIAAANFAPVSSKIRTGNTVRVDGVGAQSIVVSTASCSAGEVATGGGCNSSNFQFLYSGTPGTTNYNCQTLSNNPAVPAPSTLTAYVSCVVGVQNPPGATFALTLNIAPANGGTITANPTGVTVAASSQIVTETKDASVVLTATGLSGLAFLSWTDGSVVNPRTIIVGTDTTLGANFGTLTTSDGAVTFAGNVNVSTDNHPGRSCAQGGDAVSYSVTSLGANTATLAVAPATPSCLTAGDEVLLINLQGIPASVANVGNYETLLVQSISGSVVTFATNKTKFYGNGAGDDSNIGTAVTNQRVMLARVPRYTSMVVSSGATLTANGWNGTKGGVLFLRATAGATNNGTITMTGLGYESNSNGVSAGTGRAGPSSFIATCPNSPFGGGGPANDTGGGSGGSNCYTSGPGGGNATAGVNGQSQGGNGGPPIGGIAVATTNSTKLLMGGGGGSVNGVVSGAGGGIVALIVDTLTSTTGTIVASGATVTAACSVGTFTYGGGGGAGGAIHLVGAITAPAANVVANGGLGKVCQLSGGNGGLGRITSF